MGKAIILFDSKTVQRDDNRFMINYLPISWHQASPATTLQYPKIFKPEEIHITIDFKNAPKQFSLMEDGKEYIFNAEEMHDFVLDRVISELPRGYFAY